MGSLWALWIRVTGSQVRGLFVGPTQPQYIGNSVAICLKRRASFDLRLSLCIT
jgi:hypothetical protein